MASKKLSDGVGKKIVEALKKQSEIEITPIPNKTQEPETIENFDEIAAAFNEEPAEARNNFNEQAFTEDVSSEVTIDDLDTMNEFQAASQSFGNYQQMPTTPQDAFIKDLDTFEIPSNIAVLKKLIAQLPSGVTRHTGAQIIKQTMEALGISMKSVLQEAQQVQEGLNSSANECYNNIQEYKKQIVLMEKQAQNYNRQYTALNELISLFIQTGM